MNVCLVSYEFPPNVEGGAGTYADLLHRGLIQKGNNVVVITHGVQNEDKSIYRLNTPDIKYWRRLFFIRKANKLIETIKEEIDIVHYNEPHLILSKSSVPTVSTFHSVQINELLTKNISSMGTPETIIETMVKSPIGILGDFTSSRNTDRIICINGQIKHILKKYYRYDPNKITVIDNGVEFDNYEDDLLNTIKINDYIIPKNNYILFVGRLDPIKGIEYLIQAFKKIRKEFEIKLIIAGTGFYDKTLKSMSNDEDIVFTGHIADKKILSSLYKNSLMVVLPSLYEGLPMVLLEAMSYGKTIIASKVGGIPELIEDGKNGFLVEPRNYNQIYEKIKYLLNNQKLSDEIGLYNIKYIEENYTLGAMVDKTMGVYKELLEKG